MKLLSIMPDLGDPRFGEIHCRDVVVSPSAATRLHNHHDREVWSIISGSGCLTSGTRQITVHAGDHVEFTPFESHSIENSGVEDLRFTARWFVDWDALTAAQDETSMASDQVMIEAAFPTPNGPLHLGHLSGAYLLADIHARCASLLGARTFTYSGTYGHTNHILRTAGKKGTTYDALVATSEATIREDLALFQAQYDAFLPHQPATTDMETSIARFVAALLAAPGLVEREVLYPYSEREGTFISESYVSGQCPHCGNHTIGIECESCGLYQDECTLIAPVHTVTGESLVGKPVTRLYLRLDATILNRLATLLYAENTASSRLCYAALKAYREVGVLPEIPVSSLRDRGVPIQSDQTLTVVMERALRSYHGLSLFPSATRHLFFCGFDNMCGSGILMPYVLAAIGVPDTQLPIAVINRYCHLDGRKFSTGTGHAIWANAFLRSKSPDLVRFYLAKIHRATADSDFQIAAFEETTTRLTTALTKIFLGGRDLARPFAADPIEAGAWLNQDIIFYRDLVDAMRHCAECYRSHVPAAATERLEGLVTSIDHYITESRAYQGDADYLRTRVALIHFAYKALAYCLDPIMPGLSTRILEALGEDRAMLHDRCRVVGISTGLEVDGILATLDALRPHAER